MYNKVCRNCNNPYKATSTKQAYCSMSCNAAYRQSHIGDRFWEKVRVGGADECWEFRGNLNSSGYGTFRLGDKTVTSNRMAYYLSNGDLPKDKLVCHTCDNRRCVNPKHLWLGTNDDNMLDMYTKGRGRKLKGLECHSAKLNEQEVSRVRELHSQGWSYSCISVMYDLSKTSVSRVCTGKTWKHIA